MEDRYLRILRENWGYDSFRGIQGEIVESIGSGKDTLGLMPTGGGKSITFQVPALAKEGVCVVVTPLIALMKDQVENLRRRGILAASIHSGMTRSEIVTTLDNCILGHTKLLYVSPERLGSELFKIKLGHMKVNFITVDEAHCISQWGYDFRPSYLHIADIRLIKPDVPVLALTATATPEVVDDIQDRLMFKQKNVFRMSFERKNLAYVVRNALDKQSQMVHILKAVDGSAIVYARSRKRTKEMCEYLETQGISATFYHAGLEHSVKDERQRAWHDGEKRVMVATNAFGMGIDKPDVRTVIHVDCPDSIEAYFQEAGRAGRDGKKSYAVLLYNDNDKHKLNKRISEEFPEKDYVRQVYEHLAYFYEIGTGSGGGYTFAFDIDRFCRNFHHFPVMVNSALKILQRAGYIEYDMEPDAASRLRFLLERDDLYRLRDNSPMEETLVSTLLRTYTGLFSDYAYIDEERLAHQSGLNRQQIYLLLRSMTQRRIVHYVPQRKMPTITYLVDREDAEQLVIGKDVYDTRKEQFIKRIKAVVAYANNDDVCRSRQLLRYFGETRSDDCGACDVCLDHSQDNTSDEATEGARRAILGLLSDKKEHRITELNALDIPQPALDCALEYLVSEEQVRVEGVRIWLPA